MTKHCEVPTPSIEGVPQFYSGSAVRKNSFVLSSIWPESKEGARECNLCGSSRASLVGFLCISFLWVVLQSEAFQYSWLMADLGHRIPSET